VTQCLAILENNGYKGYVSIEFEGLEPPLDGVRVSLANLERFLEDL